MTQIKHPGATGMTQVKICGLKRVEHALVAVEAGADLLGFMFFRQTHRYVEPEAAREIIAAVRERSSVRAVGVFVNEPSQEINRIVRLASLDLVQLSGVEPDTVIRELEVPAIRALHVREDVTPESLAERALASPAELVMLDAGSPVPGQGSSSIYGGTGRPFDWDRVPSLARPFLLAGGLHAGNVPEAVRRVRPWGVDVSSGVEREGEKDAERIREFVRAVRATSFPPPDPRTGEETGE